VSALGAPVLAQVGAEVKTRLRSPATLAALLLVLAGSVLWIPDPKGNASSLSWRLADGREQAPVYSAAYIGFAASTLACLSVTLVGFYLVAGSVRRDRESGVGAILAATPLSKVEYLAGKFAAHCAYLSVVLGLALLAAMTAWLRFGVGPFSAFDFLVLFLVLSLPAVAVTASFAVLFDITPGLSGRGGYVIWFFVFSLLLVALPFATAGGASGRLEHWPLVDPAGAATDAWLARQTVPGAVGFSTGLEVRETPFTRVPWRGIPVTAALVGVRAANLLIAVAPLLLAVVLFDRFDPARRRRRVRKPRFFARRAERRRVSRESDASATVAPAHLPASPLAARPSAFGAILAESRLIWESAPFLRWPLLGSAVLAAFVPGPGGAAALLLLIVPVISEVAAREDLAGTRALVFSQPGIPRSPVLWKAAAVSLFLLALAAPLAIRTSLSAPARGLAVLAGVLFVAGAAVGMGSLTAGGKLFSGAYLVLWYLALNSLPEADFTGALGKAPVPGRSALYLLIGAALVAAAMGRERLRSR
jgi:hypothetical protein